METNERYLIMYNRYAASPPSTISPIYGELHFRKDPRLVFLLGQSLRLLASN